MANTRTFNRSFAGGELSPEMFGRLDDAKFQNGAAKLQNFIVTPTGAARNRPGFAFVKATKNNGPARLIPFTYNLNQTMVIELGAGYARFHTQGATLEYAASSASPWIAGNAAISYTTTSPAVITWPNHGLVTGNPVRLYVSTPGTLPGGLQLGYTYTANVLDANTFNLVDQGGNLVALTGGGSGGGTTYPATTSATISVYAGPNQSTIDASSPAGGLGNTPISGTITLSMSIDTSYYAYQGGGAVYYQYSIAGGSWYDFYISHANETKTVSAQISATNLDQIQVRVSADAQAGPSGSVSITGAITAWSVTAGGGSASMATLGTFYDYAAGTIVSYQGTDYVAVVADAGGTVTPGTNANIWYALPSDFTYEIPTPYAAADLFGIHYAQSADVMTLVHPNYPPSELRRMSATQWELAAINFGPPLATPANVAVAASPGYLSQIKTISTADPALITTVANHTLAMGDGVYVSNLTATIGGVATVMDGFYMVQSVPADSSGNLIPNELTLMNYSGGSLDSTGWSSYGPTNTALPITIQYGTQIFNITNPYAVQAFAQDGVSSSLLSASASVLNNLDVPGSYNTISWSAVDGAKNYNVYKQFNGLWGFIGTTQATSFVDNNIAPDMSITPGSPYTVFQSAGNYPAAVCYFQQRRCFAGTTDQPNNAWMSNSGTQSMFSFSLPSLSTDAVVFQVAALQADRIQHLMPMLQLIMLTSESEFALVPGGTTAITPTSVSVDPQSYTGSSSVQPTIINTTMVYAAARGGHVREMGYAWTVNGYMTGDLSLRAAHLFDGLTIVDQAYSKAPWPFVWFVSSSGQLLGLTYIPEEQLGAWHEHVTEGIFQSVCCVAEGSEDVLYAVITRTVDGQTVNYVERMASRIIDAADSSTWFFVDSGVTQSFGAPVTVISGLTWLEGCTVAVLADGGVQTQKVVTGGSITLDHAASVVTVGLPYTSELQTLPAVLQLDGYGQGRMKNINKAWVKVFQSSGILVGPDENRLTEIRQRTTEPWGSPPSLQSAELLVMTTPEWQSNGQVTIEQQNPLPLDVVGLTLEVAIGG